MNSSVQKVWMRVSRNAPCCICKKNDWCTYSEDAACCMRIESDRPMKNGGWLHRISEDLFKYAPAVKAEREVMIDADAMWKEWVPSTKVSMLKRLAEKLGVEALALSFLGCVWSVPNNAWAFPMRDANKRIIGIRLRSEAGDKWAVKGSRSGCFYTTKLPMGKTLFIVEGPTDCASAITMGLTAIGRPSCQGCEAQVYDYIRLNKIQEVVIVADNDTPGLRGAEKLQIGIRVPSCIFVPPAKDMREFLRLGGDKQMIESAIRNLVWTQPKV